VCLPARFQGNPGRRQPETRLEFVGLSPDFLSQAGNPAVEGELEAGLGRTNGLECSSGGGSLSNHLEPLPRGTSSPGETPFFPELRVRLDRMGLCRVANV
jgi:hypothetical protein